MQLALDLRFERDPRNQANTRTEYLVAACNRAIRDARAWRSILYRASVFLEHRGSPALFAALAETLEIEERAKARRARLRREEYPPDDQAPL